MRIGLASLFVIFITAQFSVVSAQSEAEKLHRLFADEWENRLQEDPLFASSQGVNDYNDRLPEDGEAAEARRFAQSRDFMNRLEAVNRVALSDEDKLNYDLFHFVITDRVQRAAFEPYRIPLLSDFGFHTAILRMYESVPFRTVQDYENYIARLNAVPAYFEQNMASIRVGMADGFVMQRAIMDGIVPSISSQLKDSAEDSVFYGPFTDFSDDIPAADQDRLRAAGKQTIEEAVIPSYQAFYDFFTGPYREAARETLGAYQLPGGEDYYRYLVRYFTTIDDATPEGIHELGLQEVARIRGEMEAIIAEVGFEGSFADFLDFMRTDPQFYAETPKELLAEASYIAKLIDGKMPQFFGRLPRLPYGVRAVPDDIAPNYTTGRYWGGSLEGHRAGFYMVNTYALDKRPLYNLPALTLHEGVPGHHHQNAISGELENVPDFRRDLYPNAFGEGWGLYSEKLGIEMGVYDTPYKNFGRLTYEMWRAGRLVVDTGLHAMGWTRQQAVDLFLENSALSVHNINTEVDRYISWPGQALAYKMGELKILELRARAEETLGEKFSIRDFHDAVLANGGIPLNILEAQIEAYIGSAAD